MKKHTFPKTARNLSKPPFKFWQKKFSGYGVYQWIDSRIDGSHAD